MKRIKESESKYIIKGYEYKGYHIYNHGYVCKDHQVVWEAINSLTGCADHHAETKGMIKYLIDEYGKAIN